MSKPNDIQNGSRDEPPNKSTVLLLLGTIGDTTWRMFVPIIGLLLIGAWFDKTYQTLPWATILLTIIGIAIAADLVRRQLNNVNTK